MYEGQKSGQVRLESRVCNTEMDVESVWFKFRKCEVCNVGGGYRFKETRERWVQAETKRRSS